MSKDKETLVKYLDGKVQIKSKPLAGENIPVYVRPGDKIDLELLGLNLETAKFKLVGGDLILEIPGAGNYTFVSLALMGYGENTPEFIGLGGKVTSLSAILSNIEEINALPINSVVTNEFVNLPDASEQDKKNKANEEKKNEATPQVIVIDNNIATDDNISQSLAESTAQFFEQSIEESVVNENISMKIKTDKAKATKTEDATEDSKEDSKEDDTEDSKGDASVEGIEPTLSFDINIQHVEKIERIVENEKKLFVYGGGGTSYANIYPKGYNSVDKTALVAQTKTETIDYSDKSGSYDSVVIHADDSALFGITKTSRTIQLTPSQPEGFQITKVTISSADFPEGFSALKGVLSGDTWTIQKDNPLTEKIDGFTISNNGVINITFSVDNTQDSNFVFSLNAISEFNMDNVSESNKDIIIAPIKTLLEFEKDYAVQVKNIENETKDKEYDFKSFSLNGKEYETGFVITTNINDTKTVGAQELVNTIYGGIVNDTIYGGTKNDTIYGNTGDDTIITRAGNYIVDGGVGTDTVDYSYISDTKAINVDLNRATEVVFQIGTPTNYDNLTHIENIIATKNNDLIKGSDDFAVVNILDGYKGDDVFYSSKGIDSFIGGLGIDTLDFSSVDLLNGGKRVIVDLGLGKITDDGYHDTTNTAVEDYVSEIEIVIGTTGDDNLYGDSNKNTLVGANGDDIIYGREGADSLNGGAGADVINGGDDSDIILGGTDSDNIDGGTGADNIDGEAGDDIIVGGAGNDNLKGGAGADVINGGDDSDIILGGTDSDNIDGGTGADNIDGEAGDDVIVGGTGNDTLTGGSGIDELSYVSALSRITVTLANGSTAFGTITSTTEGTDKLLDHFEIIRGSNYEDIFTGFNGTAVIGVNYSDTLYGEGDNDTIYGGLGDDSLNGGGGDDTFRGQAGNDIIDGDTGTNTIDFSDATATGVTVYLDGTDGAGVAVAYQVMADGFGGKDIVTKVTKIIGSGFKDTLKGTSGDDVLQAGAGDDFIISTGGADTVAGGANTTNTGGGDWLSFQLITTENTVDPDGYTGVKANMSGRALSSGLGSTNISGIENIKGTIFKDLITGDTGNNSLDGYSGNDLISGGAGKDYLLGGDGDDTLRGDSGVDIYDGGAGEDILDFYSAGAIVKVDLSSSTNKVVDDGYGNAETSVTGIENIGGTLLYNDTLRGDNNDNKIYGYGGNDSLYGLGGVDTIFGDTGNDNIYTGTGIGDVALGEGGTDTLYGNFDSDFLIGGVVSSTLIDDPDLDWINLTSTTAGVILDLSTTVTAGTGVYAGSYSQALVVDATPLDNTDNTQFDYIRQIENITGSSGDDTFTGNASQNSILAGDGDDIIYYTRGLDYYDGGNHTTSTGQGSGTPVVGGGDWISLAKETTTQVNFDLNGSNVGSNITNGLATVTNIENVIGYNGVQTTVGWGSTGNNTFVMYDGADQIIGRQGNDLYDLGAGNDIAYASYGNDTIIGGAGLDRLDYTNQIGSNQANYIILTNQDLNGDGDTLDANESVTTSSITVQGLATLTDGTYTFFKIRDGRTGFFDYLYREADGTADIEIFYLSNITAQADIFSGDADANTVYAYAGNDTVYGQGGNDSLYGERGVDILYGNDGADRLEGGLGADSLYGGIGNDTIYSDDGADIIDGGADTDLLLFTGGSARVVVNLSTSSITYDTTNSLAANRVLDSVGHTDTVVNLSIENVTGGTNADTFAGSAANNVLNGADGNDYFYASLGTDNIIGGNGADTLDFTNLTTTAGVNVTLNTSLSFSGITQTVTTMENFTGSSQNDTITGDGVANVLNGGAGDDTIDGKAGNDVINGGAGNDLFIIDFSSIDTIDGGANTLKDTVKFNAGNTGTSISADTDFVMNSTLTNIEKLDITGLTLNTANDNTEFNFTEAMIDAWTGNSTGNLTLSFTTSQVEKIKFTDSSSVVHDSAATIVDNTSYTIGNSSLTIDIIDVP